MFSSPRATVLVPILLLGFPVLVVVMFLMMPARRAVLWSVILAALFLPEGAYSLQGLPEYSKYSALSVVLLVSIVLDGGRPLRLRPCWVDLPVLYWVGGRFFTSLSNGLGAYDGVSSVTRWLVLFGLPYWLGRTYFSDRDGLRELAKGIVWGGLLYMPFCLWEIRFSPQLHSTFYGFSTVPFYMILRYGGYRPMVFMDSSLQVAMWMSASTVMTWWMAHSGALKQIYGVPAKWLAYALLVTLVLCKAKGAAALAFVGIGLFYVFRSTRSALPLALLVALVASYPALRGVGLLDAERVKSVAALVFDEERVYSLGVRLRSEDMYVEHALERPLLGWGGYGRGDVRVDGERSIPDGLWVIALSRSGWTSVVALLALYLLPAVLLMRRHRAALYTRPEFVPVAGLCVVLVLYWIDCLSNAMVTPVLVVALGAGAGWFTQRRAEVAPPAPSDAPPEPAPSDGPDLANARPVSLARGLKARRDANAARRSP